MTKEDLQNIVLAYLGSGVLEVELSQAQLDVVVGSALRWLSRFVKKTGSLALDSGQSRLDLSGLPANSQVVDVRRSFAPVPFSPFMFGETQDSIGEYAIEKNYSEVVRKMLGRDPIWKYDPPWLYISPPLMEGETAKVYYVYPISAVEDVSDEFLQPLIEYAKGEAKEILGRIRGKYRGVPAPDGQIELDSDLLLQEAREDKARAEEMLRRLVPSPSFVIG